MSVCYWEWTTEERRTGNSEEIKKKCLGIKPLRDREFNTCSQELGLNLYRAKHLLSSNHRGNREYRCRHQWDDKFSGAKVRVSLCYFFYSLSEL